MCLVWYWMLGGVSMPVMHASTFCTIWQLSTRKKTCPCIPTELR